MSLEQTIKLDNLDKEIITELQKDATISYKHLAKKIGAAEGEDIVEHVNTI